MWERFLIAAQGLLRGQRQDSSQCPLGSYDKKEGFCVRVLKFLIFNVCDSFISNVFQVFLTAFYSFLLFTRVSFLILKDFSLKERTVTIPCGSGDYDTVGSYDKKEGYFV